MQNCLHSMKVKLLITGYIVEGTVVEVRNNEVIVDLGGFKYNGQLAADQLTDDPALKPSDVSKRRRYNQGLRCRRKRC